MNRFDNSNQVDSPSLFAGEIRTGMGRARQSSGKYINLTKRKQKQNKNLICQILIKC